MKLRCLFTKYQNTTPKPQKISYIANPITIGDHIRNKRILKGLLQKEVADLFQVTEDTITNWENNRCKPLDIYHFKLYQFLEIEQKIDTQSLGEIIKVSRLKAGLSQSKLAKMMQVHKCTIRSWEENTNIPTKKLLIKLSATLKLTL